MNERLLNTLLIALLIVLTAMPAAGYGESERRLHGAIIISKPGDLSPENGVVGGSGTKNDPFLINNWKIDASAAGFGIKITNVHVYIVIRNISIQSASIAGMQIVGVPHVSIQGCEFRGNSVGLALKSLSGATVRGSRFVDCTGTGIRMEECRNSTVDGNEFVGRNSGIVVMDGSTSNLIVENAFRGRASLSLYLGSGGNRIYHNNFFEAVVMDMGYNVWDNGREGNFWGKQYHGRDKNNDGIGDSPHKIQGGYNYDRHPLMSPWEP